MATISTHESYIRTLDKKLDDDTKFSPPVIYRAMVSARSFLLSRKLRNFQAISDSSYIVTCVPLSSSNFFDCSCVPSPDCVVMKSDCKIPTVFTSRNRSMITVSLMNGAPLQYVPLHKLQAKKSSILQKPYYTIHDGYIVVFNSGLEIVLLRAIVEDPVVLDNFCNCGATPQPTCYNSAEQDFPIDPDLVQPMYDMVITQLLQADKNKEDEVNDARSQE